MYTCTAPLMMRAMSSSSSRSQSAIGGYRGIAQALSAILLVSTRRLFMFGEKCGTKGKRYPINLPRERFRLTLRKGPKQDDHSQRSPGTKGTRQTASSVVDKLSSRIRKIAARHNVALGKHDRHRSRFHSKDKMNISWSSSLTFSSPKIIHMLYRYSVHIVIPCRRGHTDNIVPSTEVHHLEPDTHNPLEPECDRKAASFSVMTRIDGQCSLPEVLAAQSSPKVRCIVHLMMQSQPDLKLIFKLESDSKTDNYMEQEQITAA
ncbi:hypothetical protein OBBRIDRAFT_808844 [Obba rivulosa]|uniref:Uncharacterized protein n=1 Tax=Obba rivulosa TaxID=1052685 RepID=A0A8E2AKK2_9APHY|nr:hypothetical protein OBBRIDRAFT_808844 [Obba rivulosa]